MLTIKIIGTDEKGKEWLDIIMSEEGLTTEPGHRESRVLFKLPDPDKAPNEGAEPDSGPESIMSELDSESSTTAQSKKHRHHKLRLRLLHLHHKTRLQLLHLQLPPSLHTRNKVMQNYLVSLTV